MANRCALRTGGCRHGALRRAALAPWPGRAVGRSFEGLGMDQPSARPPLRRRRPSAAAVPVHSGVVGHTALMGEQLERETTVVFADILGGADLIARAGDSAAVGALGACLAH